MTTSNAAAPCLSILIITYNRAADTLSLLENLAEQEQVGAFLGEILLLNNHSSDDYTAVKDFVSRTALPIRYIDSDKNLGVSGGRNLLVKEAKFPYLVMLDDDLVFSEPDAVKTIGSLFDKEQYRKHNTGVITFHIRYYDTLEIQQSAFPHKRFEAYKDKDWFLTYYFAGGAHVVKKELFDTIGNYPEDFFYGMEEYDFSMRALDAGYTLAYDSSVRVLHKESPLGRVPTKEKLRMMWRNKCVVWYRYLPTKYFYGALVMWALFYLKKSGYDFGGMLRYLREHSRIPQSEHRKSISAKALAYLHQVKARLWY